MFLSSTTKRTLLYLLKLKQEIEIKRNVHIGNFIATVASNVFIPDDVNLVYVIFYLRKREKITNVKIEDDKENAGALIVILKVVFYDEIVEMLMVPQNLLKINEIGILVIHKNFIDVKVLHSPVRINDVGMNFN